MLTRIGFLGPMGRESATFDAFRQGLSDLGYIERRNTEIVKRFAEGQYDRFPALIDDLMKAKVSVIAVQGAVTLRAAKKAVAETPIVFTIVLDPVREELITNPARPGGNITGVTTFDPQQPGKQLALLQRVIPGLRCVALLGDAGISEALIAACEEQARILGIKSQRYRVAGPTPNLEDVFAGMRQAHAEALMVMEEPVLVMHARQIAQLASRNRIPALCSPIQPDAGGLLAYGTSFNAGMRHMAVYVDKILKGAKAGDLPVETLTRYELIVNLKTAREIGVTVPPEVLKRADRVIP